MSEKLKFYHPITNSLEEAAFSFQELVLSTINGKHADWYAVYQILLQDPEAYSENQMLVASHSGGYGEGKVAISLPYEPAGGVIVVEKKGEKTLARYNKTQLPLREHRDAYRYTYVPTDYLFLGDAILKNFISELEKFAVFEESQKPLYPKTR